MSCYANPEMTVLCERIHVAMVDGKPRKVFARYTGKDMASMKPEGNFYVPKSIPDYKVPSYARPVPYEPVTHWKGPR